MVGLLRVCSRPLWDSRLAPVQEATAAQEGVFSGGDGVIYRITPDGNLDWYRHDGWKTGTRDWTGGPRRRNVGIGWNVSR